MLSKRLKAVGIVLLLFLVICLKDMDMQYYLVQNDYYFDVNLYIAFVIIFILGAFIAVE